MRDPYHAARVRFKVARDRFIYDELRNDPHYGAARQRYIIPFFALARCGEYSRANDPLFNEMVEAAGILRTMIKWKETDEKRAQMLWKLSRA